MAGGVGGQNGTKLEIFGAEKDETQGLQTHSRDLHSESVEIISASDDDSGSLVETTEKKGNE